MKKKPLVAYRHLEHLVTQMTAALSRIVITAPKNEQSKLLGEATKMIVRARRLRKTSLRIRESTPFDERYNTLVWMVNAILTVAKMAPPDDRTVIIDHARRELTSRAMHHWRSW